MKLPCFRMEGSLEIFPSGALPEQTPVSIKSAARKRSAEGWRTRVFEQTALDCLISFRSRGETLDWTDYLSAAKDKQVLDAWVHQSS
jgi:hypothetical protein